MAYAFGKGGSSSSKLLNLILTYDSICIFNRQMQFYHLLAVHVDLIIYNCCIFSELIFFSFLTLIFYFYFFRIIIFFFLCFYGCLNTLVSIFSPPLSQTPAIHTSLPQSYPALVLSMCPLYMFLDNPSPFSLHYSLPPSLWLLSVCSQFQRFWLYFACLFVLLTRFYL